MEKYINYFHAMYRISCVWITRYDFWNLKNYSHGMYRISCERVHVVPPIYLTYDVMNNVPLFFLPRNVQKIMWKLLYAYCIITFPLYYLSILSYYYPYVAPIKIIIILFNLTFVYGLIIAIHQKNKIQFNVNTKFITWLLDIINYPNKFYWATKLLESPAQPTGGTEPTVSHSAPL